MGGRLSRWRESMKKLWTFLRSMRFGILLLVLIAVCSVIGSVIPQGKEIAWYAQTYRGAHGAILLLGLHHIFTSWYFVALLILLCLNLTLCSLTRIGALAKGNGNAVEAAARLPNEARLTEAGADKLRAHMKTLRCREERLGSATVWHKNEIGRYGTFLTHLSILLTVVFGATALYLPTVTDRTCLPGEALTMPDGTVIAVDDFSIENSGGQLDYASRLRVTLPDGRESEATRVSVNHPMSFGAYKIYQQTYGTAGSVTVTNLETGGADDFTLTEPVFLSADGRNGLWYEALYPGYVRDPSGNVTLITNTTGSYYDPVYQVQVASDGVYTPTLAFPGDSVRVNGLEFTFNDPVEYPGLRIKKTPAAVNALLIAAFALMTVGLYITFFMQPVLVKLDAEGYAVGGPKPEGMRVELALLLKDDSLEDNDP